MKNVRRMEKPAKTLMTINEEEEEMVLTENQGEVSTSKHQRTVHFSPRLDTIYDPFVQLNRRSDLKSNGLQNITPILKKCMFLRT